MITTVGVFALTVVFACSLSGAISTPEAILGVQSFFLPARLTERLFRMQHFDSFSAEDTWEIGKKLAETAKPGEIYALSGDLGVGKTVFTKGFAAGLGITEPVNSPTFTILQIYEGGRLPLYHFDVYRIEEPEEMEEVGLDDYLFGQGVCLIEWAEQIAEELPESTKIVRIRKDLSKGLDYRAIDLED